MSAPDKFEQLMNQYSSEAQAEAERAYRAERRRKLFKAITKYFFVLAFLAAAGATYVYRVPLMASLSQLKMKTLGEMQAERKAKAEGKAVEAQKLGTERVKEFEATIK
jgi:hypothetical protein